MLEARDEPVSALEATAPVPRNPFEGPSNCFIGTPITAAPQVLSPSSPGTKQIPAKGPAVATRPRSRFISLLGNMKQAAVRYHWARCIRTP